MKRVGQIAHSKRWSAHSGDELIWLGKIEQQLPAGVRLRSYRAGKLVLEVASRADRFRYHWQLAEWQAAWNTLSPNYSIDQIVLWLAN